MDPFNTMRENEKGLLKLMLLQPPTLPEDTCGEATIRIKLNMPNLAYLGHIWPRLWDFYAFLVLEFEHVCDGVWYHWASVGFCMLLQCDNQTRKTPLNWRDFLHRKSSELCLGYFALHLMQLWPLLDQEWHKGAVKAALKISVVIVVMNLMQSLLMKTQLMLDLPAVWNCFKHVNQGSGARPEKKSMSECWT